MTTQPGAEQGRNRTRLASLEELVLSLDERVEQVEEVAVDRVSLRLKVRPQSPLTGLKSFSMSFLVWATSDGQRVLAAGETRKLASVQTEP